MIVEASHRSRDPHYAFVKDATASWHDMPVVEKILNADPALRAEVLDKSYASFNQGGWYASSVQLFNLISARVGIYADDRHMLELLRVKAELSTRLLHHPEHCLQLWRDDLTWEEAPEAGDLYERYWASFYAAMANGDARRHDAAVPRFDESLYLQFGAIETKLAPILGPDLSIAMRDLTSKPTESFCAGWTKWVEAALALPEAEGAKVMRYLLARRVRDAWARVHAPEGFACPSPGTRFLLTATTGHSSLRASQVAGRQAGFACEADGTLGGHTVLDGAMFPDTHGEIERAALRELWPLDVGKRSEYSLLANDGQTIAVRFRVVSYATVDVPAGSFAAFEIRREVVTRQGAAPRVLRIWWSPELHWAIAQRVERLPGDSDEAGLDWDLAQIVPPGGKRGPTWRPPEREL